MMRFRILAVAIFLWSAVTLSAQLAMSSPGPALIGQTVPFHLAATSDANRVYLGALSLGIEPGIVIDQRVLSLAVDPVFLYSISPVPPPELVGFYGVLDSVGVGEMSMIVPNDPNLAGLAFYTAAVTFDPSAPSGVSSISNSLRRRLALQAPNYDFSAVSAFLQSTSATLPPDDNGIALVLMKDGEIIFQEAYGDIGLNTRVAIASASKWVSAATLMTLVRDGLIDLDDRVSDYVPGFTGLKSLITIRQCLSHTSGLPGNNLAISNPNLTLEQSTAVAAQGPLLAVPGAEFRYGGVSMSVAGRVAEVATGQPFGQIFQTRVAGPLGMTTFDYDAFGPTLNPQLAGAGKCTAIDYAQFLLAFLDNGAKGGQSILPTNFVREMFEDQTNGADIAASPRDPSYRYGLGLWRDQIGPNGELLAVSSPGAFGAFPWIDLERGYAGFILIHQNAVVGQAFHDALLPLIEAEIE